MARIRKRCGWDELVMPVASFINIIFILVIFFIAAEAINSEMNDRQISMPSSSLSKPFSKKDPRSMTVNIRKDGTVNIGVAELTIEEMKLELKEAVNEWGDDLPVIIRGDKDVQLSYIRDVMAAVSAAGIKKIVFNSITR